MDAPVTELASAVTGLLGVILGWILRRPNAKLQWLVIVHEVVNAVQRYLADASDDDKKRAAVAEIRRIAPGKSEEEIESAVEKVIAVRRAIGENKGWRK